MCVCVSIKLKLVIIDIPFISPYISIFRNHGYPLVKKHSYRKWVLIVSFPNKNVDVP